MAENNLKFLNLPYHDKMVQEAFLDRIFNVNKEFAAGIKSIMLQDGALIYSLTIDVCKNGDIEMEVVLAEYGKKNVIKTLYLFHSKEIFITPIEGKIIQHGTLRFKHD